MDIEVETQLAPLSLAAARALFRAPQAEDACWADVHMPDGTVRASDVKPLLLDHVFGPSSSQRSAP